MRLVGFLLALFAWATPYAQGVLPVPELTARVIDQTGTLDAIQRKGLDDKLAAFEQQKGTQIVMLLVPTTLPEDISSYANRVANAWKIGRKEVGDGIIVVVAKNDRKVRIEVAKTLEGAVPDLAARQIIDEAITPKFRQNDFAGGLQGAADQLIARVSGEKLPEPPQPGRQEAPQEGFAAFDLVSVGMLMFIFVPFLVQMLKGMFGNKLGTLAAAGGAGLLANMITASLLIAGIAAGMALLISLFSSAAVPGRRHRGGHGGPVIFPGGWGGGGGGGGGGGWSSGGGGFSSGGGGDFGGGGASGEW